MKDLKKYFLTQIYANQTQINADLLSELSAIICVTSAKICVQKWFLRGLLIILFLLLSKLAIAGPVSIEGVSKVRSSKGYAFTINYQTEEEWTDGIIFKLHCKFNRGENIVFSSGGLNNIKRGWHKVTVNIPKVYRERYGPIIDYRIELYHRGVLAALRGI